MKNKLFLPSMITLISLYGILILILLIIFNLLEISINYLLIGSIFILILQFLFSPLIMDMIMKSFYKADFAMEMPDYLKQYVLDICKKNKMKYPKIGYIDDGAPNAFTYGRTKNDARIVFTRGILDLLSPDEVKTVLSHEIGHAVHYDMFLMTTVQIVPLILYDIYYTSFNSTKKGKDKNGKTTLVGFMAYFLYIISEYIILWFSRTREYYADEFAIKATENPNGLASALVKIGYGLTTNSKDGKNINISTINALGIFDSKASKALVVSSSVDSDITKESIKKAARWELWNPWAIWYEMNSTHPMISKRIKNICKYCPNYDQPQFIVFDEKKPKSYVSNFTIELFIKYLPIIVFISLILIGLLGYNYITNISLFFGISIVIFSISLLIPFLKSHKNYKYENTNISQLLSNVEVSGITSVPCIVKGRIIGSGNPGYIFSEDFVVKDDTGIVFLDYKQPLSLINVMFALLKSKKYIDKNVEIKGWYRRAPIPYIEILTITMDGKVNTCYSYIFTKVIIYLLMVIGFGVVIFSLI